MTTKDQITYVKVDEDGTDIYVVCCTENDTTTDSLFDAEKHELRRDRRAAAEQRAEVLAKLYGCEWGANY